MGEIHTVTGEAIGQQLATGTLRFYRREIPRPKERSQLSWEQESQRFHQARQGAVRELSALYNQAVSQVGEETASIFSIHAMLLEDEDYILHVLDTVQKAAVTAEFAVRATGQSFAAAFAAMDSAYMQARAVDFRDITRRVMFLLMGLRWEDPLEQGPAILVSDEFLPSEVMHLSHQRLLGIVSCKGSVDSHTAMLLRACHIPAMARVELGCEWDGHRALLDGQNHRLYLDPDDQLLQRLTLQRSERPTPQAMN